MAGSSAEEQAGHMAGPGAAAATVTASEAVAEYETSCSEEGDFVKCGTYGCSLRDGHLGLHNLPTFDRRARRRAAPVTTTAAAAAASAVDTSPAALDVQLTAEDAAGEEAELTGRVEAPRAQDCEEHSDEGGGNVG
eukprot:2619037-Prymnesium_polylepis.1